VAFSPCGHLFATEHVMQGHTRLVVALAFSAGGGKVASGSWDGSILLWEAKTGTLLRTIDAHPRPSMLISVASRIFTFRPRTVPGS